MNRIRTYSFRKALLLCGVVGFILFSTVLWITPTKIQSSVAVDENAEQNQNLAPVTCFPASSGLVSWSKDENSPNDLRGKSLCSLSPNATVLPYGANNYRYSIVPNNQTPPSDFGSLTYNDSAWLIGQAAFSSSTGNVGGCVPPTPVITTWGVNSRLLTRKRIILPNSASNVRLFFAIDNNIEKVFFNGVLVPFTYASGCPSLDATSITIPQNLVQNGENLIAIQAYDFGQYSFFDMRVQADLAVNNSNRKFDFDGDGKTDLSIFRPNAAAEWWYQKSSNGGNAATQFGASTDKPVPADFTGDGKTDAAFFRPSTGEWFILRSEDSSFYAFPFGSSADIPLPGDYDGDGKADQAVFRPSSATWYISKSSGGTTISQFGLNGDIPVQADYDGDGKADLAIFRPTISEWWYVKSSNGQAVGLQFGTADDKVVPADYTGDGKTDVAVWRPTNGNWFVLRSEDFSYYAAPFGANGDFPVPGDYDGDGKSDIAIFRGGNWYLSQSTDGVSIRQFGFATDKPVPAAYIP